MKLQDKKYYNIYIDKLVLLMLPTFLRKKRLAYFIRILIFPIKEIYRRFQDKQKNDWYRLNHNSQVFSLRKVLNDYFDNELRRIQIIDCEKKDRLYIYTSFENRPLYIGKKYIYTRGEHSGIVDFIVVVPPNLEYDVYKMREIIDTYKLITKEYIIRDE